MSSQKDLPELSPFHQALGKNHKKSYPLEARLLLDGTVAPLAVATTELIDAASSEPAPAMEDVPLVEVAPSGDDTKPISEDNLDKLHALLQGEHTPEALIFIDSAVEDAQGFIEALDTDATVFTLDANLDGVLQMQAIIEALGEHSGFTPINSLHIISHGSEGQLNLGNGVLNAETMQNDYASALSSIGEALSDNADILIYGCNFTEGEAGLSAANLLAELTDADIAASDDLTGSSELGGNWVLESTTGLIESTTINANNWQGVLSAVEWSITNPTSSATEGNTLDFTIGLTGTLALGEDASVDIALSDIDTTIADYSTLSTAIDNAIDTYSGSGDLSFDGTTLTLEHNGEYTATYDATGALGATSISASGTALNPASSDSITSVAMGFNFEFYGTNYNTVYISDNGVVNFTSFSMMPSGNLSIANGTALSGLPLIAPYWDYLRANLGGNIYHELTGSAGSYEFIVEWHQVNASESTGDGATFQMVLHEATGEIEFRYLDVDFDGTSYDFGRSATIGIQGGNGSGLEYAYNEYASVVANGSSISITNDAPITMSDLTFSITAIDDANFESVSEDFSVNLSNPNTTTGVTVSIDGANNSVISSILPHSSPEWSIIQSSSIAYEGSGIQYTIDLNGLLEYGTDASIDISLLDIDTDSSDYANLTTAINDAISNYTGLAEFSFDGTTLTVENNGGYYASGVIGNSSATTISGSGTPLGLTAYGSELHANIGFNFEFYGQTYSEFWVSDRGILNFIDNADMSWSNQNLSTGTELNGRAAIAPFWDDLYPVLSGEIYTQLTGAVGSRQLTIEWHQIHHWSDRNGNGATFQVILHEGSNNIEFHYIDVGFDSTTSYDNGLSASIGLQNGLGIGNAFSYNTAAVTNGSSILFHSQGALDATPLTFTLNAISDGLDEVGGEDYSISLSNASAVVGHTPTINGSNNSVTTSINDVADISWSISGDTEVADGGSANYTISLDGGLNADASTSIDLSLTDITTDASDYSSLTSAINNAISSYSGDGSLSFDGTTLSYTNTGYSLSNDPSGASGATSISGTGTALGIAADDVELNVNIGFNFNFFGTDYSQFWVSDNGVLNFEDNADMTYNNVSMSSGTELNNRPAIAPFWDDLYPLSGGDIYTELNGVIGSRTLTVEWHNMHHYSDRNGDGSTFQMILYEGSNNIEFRYLDLDFDSSTNYDYGKSATIGIQDGSGVGMEYSFNSESLTDGHSLLFVQNTGSVSMDDLTITLNLSNDLVEGEESFQISISNPQASVGFNPLITNGNLIVTIDDSDSAVWALSSNTADNVNEGDTVEYTLSLGGSYAFGESFDIDLAIDNIDTTSSDYEDLTTAINQAIASHSQADALSFDGTTLSVDSSSLATFASYDANGAENVDSLVTPPSLDGINYNETGAAGATSIAGTGTDVNAGDESNHTAAIGFTFDFAGVNYTDVHINSNGFVTFGAASGGINYRNFDMGESVFAGNPGLAVLWDDYDASADASAEVYYETQGVIGSREFIVEWQNVPYYHQGDTNGATFQLVLFEGSNNIEYRYLDVEFGPTDGSHDNGLNATIGLQDHLGQRGVYSHNTASVASGSSILIEHGSYSFSAGSIQGTALNIAENTIVNQSLNGGVGADFNFEFMGNTYTDIYISDNGYVTFGAATSSSFTANGDIEAGTNFEGLPAIAPYWDILAALPAYSDVFVAVDGIEGERTYTIEWHDMETSTGNFTFQLVLHENSNDIVVNYLNVAGSNNTTDLGLSASIGIQNGSGYGLEYSQNTASVTSGSSLTINNVHQTLGLGGLFSLDDLVFNLDITNDTVDEYNEDFRLYLANSSGSGGVTPAISSSNQQVQLTINDVLGEKPEAEPEPEPEPELEPESEPELTVDVIEETEVKEDNVIASTVNGGGAVELIVLAEEIAPNVAPEVLEEETVVLSVIENEEVTSTLNPTKAIFANDDVIYSEPNEQEYKINVTDNDLFYEKEVEVVFSQNGKQELDHSHGKWVIEDNHIKFIPKEGVNLPDEIKVDYQICEAGNASNCGEATFTIKLKDKPSSNDKQSSLTPLMPNAEDINIAKAFGKLIPSSELNKLIETDAELNEASVSLFDAAFLSDSANNANMDIEMALNNEGRVLLANMTQNS